MNDRGGIDDLCGWFKRLAIRLAHQAKLANDLCINLGTAIAKGVVEACGPIENLGQFFIELADLEGLVSLVVAHCAFYPRPVAIPYFALRSPPPPQQGKLLLDSSGHD